MHCCGGLIVWRCLHRENLNSFNLVAISVVIVRKIGYIFMHVLFIRKWFIGK